MPYLSLIVLLTDSRVPILDELYSREIKKKWPHKNILSIFTKSDLVETKPPNSFNLFKPSSRHQIIKLIRETLKKLNLNPKEDTNSIIIMGGTNSGKSSFINLLVGRKKTKKSPEPGTTRSISRHKIPSTNLLVYDSPGLFPSNIGKNMNSLLQLLNFLPKVSDDTTNFSEWGYNYLMNKYPNKIEKLCTLENVSIKDYYSFLQALASRYKLLEKKGELSIEKAEKKFIQLVRNGSIGKILWDIQ